MFLEGGVNVQVKKRASFSSAGLLGKRRKKTPSRVHLNFSYLPTHLGGFEGGMGVCIVVPPKKGRSQDTARQARRMRVREKMMVVLPITRSVAQIRFREGGGQGRGKQRVGVSGVGGGVAGGEGSSLISFFLFRSFKISLFRSF